MIPQTAKEIARDFETNALDVNPESAREIAMGCLSSGFTRDEARVYAAKELSSASNEEIEDALGLDTAECETLLAGIWDTTTAAKNQFFGLVDGPKNNLATIEEEAGDTTTEITVFQYNGATNTEDMAEYGIISFEYNGQYYDRQSFESFSLTRYGTITDVAEDFYEEHVFDDIQQANRVWTMLIKEGMTRDMISPASERASIGDHCDSIEYKGHVYLFSEETSNVSRISRWDDAVVIDGEVVDVIETGGDNPVTVRAESGAELSRYSDANLGGETAKLYRDVGPVP